MCHTFGDAVGAIMRLVDYEVQADSYKRSKLLEEIARAVGAARD